MNMTTDEAIEELQERVDFANKEWKNYVPEYVEALQMAIKALKQKNSGFNIPEPKIRPVCPPRPKENNE